MDRWILPRNAQRRSQLRRGLRYIIRVKSGYSKGGGFPGYYLSQGSRGASFARFDLDGGLERIVLVVFVL